MCNTFFFVKCMKDHKCVTDSTMCKTYLFNVKDGCVSIQTACDVLYYYLYRSTFYDVFHFCFVKCTKNHKCVYKFKSGCVILIYTMSRMDVLA